MQVHAGEEQGVDAGLLQKERELSMTSLSRSGSGTSALLKQQQDTDRDVGQMKSAFAELASQAPDPSSSFSSGTPKLEARCSRTP